MLEFEVRTPTAEEQGRLEKYRHAQGGLRFLSVGWLYFLALFTAIFLGSCLIVVAAGRFFPSLDICIRGKGWSIILPVSLFSSACCISAFILSYRRNVKPYNRDLRENRVEVLHGTVEDAMRLTDFLCGPAYFLDLGNGQIIFLDGHHLEKLNGKGKHPTRTDQIEKDEDPEEFPINRNLDVVRAIHSGKVIDVICRGETFFSSKFLDPYELDIALPKDGEVFAGRIATLQEDLKERAKISKPHRFQASSGSM